MTLTTYHTTVSERGDLRDLDRRVNALLEEIQGHNQRAWEHIKKGYIARVKLGGAAQEYAEQHAESKTEAMQEFSERYHLSPPTAYEYRKRWNDLQGDLEGFSAWLDAQKEEHGKVTWKRAAGLLPSQKNGVSEEAGREEKLTKVLKSAETLERQASLLVDDFLTAGDEARAEALLHALRVAEDAREQAQALKGIVDPKKRRITAPGYLSWLREQSCVATGRPPEVMQIQAAHTEPKGNKGSDFFALPLSADLHIPEQHVKGIQAFYAEYGIDPWEEVAKHLQRYALEEPDSFIKDLQQNF